MTTKRKGPIIDPGICRCCGALKKCRLLNYEYENSTLKEIYSDMLMECFGLLLSHLDGKPTERLVCATCVQRLREACSFRQQVIKCEETFLKAKVYTREEKVVGNKIEARQRIEIEEVPIEMPTIQTTIKIEKQSEDMIVDEGSPVPPSPLSDDDSQSDDNGDIKNDIIKRRPSSSNSDNMPLKSFVFSRKPQKTESSKKINDRSMQIIQSKIREQDASHKTEWNIQTLVENSYVCPFKCRHNYLLCYYCGQHFTDIEALREHTERIHDPKKFKLIDYKNMLKVELTRIDCRLCEQKIDTLEQFKRHISDVHAKNYYFNHRDSVLPFKFTKAVVKCALCDAVFPYFHALNKHMNQHFSNYVCEQCGMGFVDRGRFVMHQQKHETTEYPCPTCGKVFKAVYNRDLHVDRVHNKKGRVYCPKCDVMLMSYPQKLKHLVEVHGEAPLSFPCGVCDMTFDTRRNVTLHKRKVHLKDYRYECQTCGQRFFTRFALTNHMPTHTGERNFSCKICGKSYPRLKTLKYHIRIHTNDRRYRCHVCGQAFIQNCSLKGHMKSQHPEYS
ncbi:zinc finger protein 260-like isoform X2 [Aricia agestis]|uniref:zinc finger protein 260-like isoform X2 n=1 Tax=Aricia agestis TaxID=91739 RepID=UPI001C2043F6|nr:zinc finger protein 260-like isoform X2 [Aricia agestis]